MRLRRPLRVLPALVVVGFVVLWLLGPLPIQSRAYVQNVTTTSAVLARLDRHACRLRARVSHRSPHGPQAPPILAVDPAPTTDHALAVTGLQPDTRYRFELESIDDAGRGGPVVDAGEFRTAPDSDLVPLRFVAVGDTGHIPWWCEHLTRFGLMRIRPALAWLGDLGGAYDLARWMQRQEPDLFMHLGDVIYPKGRTEFYEEGFFRPFGDLLRQTATYAVLGNHDAHTDHGAPFLRVFHLPTNAETGDERFYTFAWGPVRFVCLDTSLVEVDRLDLTTNGPQSRWLRATLAAATEPWLVVVQHHPFYCSSVHRDEPRMINWWWSIMREARVDLILSGHSHDYLRYKPVDGVLTVVAGGGGHSIYPVKKEDPRLDAWSEEPAFLRIDVSGLELRGELLSGHGHSLDTFTLARGDADAVPADSPRGQRIARLRAALATALKKK